MTAIHHATATRAANLGIRLEPTDTGVIAFIKTDDGTEYPCPECEKAKDAVEQAILYIEEIAAGADPEELFEEPEKETGSIVKSRYKKRYAAAGDPTSCGDEMAAELKAATLTTDDKGKDVIDMPTVRLIAVDNDLEGKYDEWTAKMLNNGMVRMNLGNMLRAKLRRGEAINIAGHEIAPEGYYEDEAA